jgi:hypothetical protein
VRPIIKTPSRRFQVATLALAQALWAARRRAFELQAPTWGGLEPSTRRIFVTQAEDILRILRPPPGSLFEE